jgi:hypothetical protein
LDIGDASGVVARGVLACAVSSEIAGSLRIIGCSLDGDMTGALSNDWLGGLGDELSIATCDNISNNGTVFGRFSIGDMCLASAASLEVDIIFKRLSIFSGAIFSFGGDEPRLIVGADHCKTCSVSIDS